jgi:hypothetical protein
MLQNVSREIKHGRYEQLKGMLNHHNFIFGVLNGGGPFSKSVKALNHRVLMVIKGGFPFNVSHAFYLLIRKSSITGL